MSKEKAWEAWFAQQGIDIGTSNNSTLVSAYKAAMMVAFSAGYDAAIKDVREMIAEREGIITESDYWVGFVDALNVILEEIGRLK